ncbi:MAG: LL-diaminopimelate aminotransferase [Candidatus Latescibacteria bacterium]|nr:LL-diaminopimelate aminotransferase [Candidatus Latescibacterota bacterium]
MAKINANYDKLAAGYLFPEIARRTQTFLDANSGVSVMRLGIGNTTEPLPKSVIAGLHDAVDQMANVDTYRGYADGGEGEPEMREALAKRYEKYGVEIDASEVFVSDGAKADSANIQSIFGMDNVIAVQDPAYPVYVDSNVISGRTGEAVDGQYDGLVYMPCGEENGFMPEVPNRKVDLIYICSPNNPTGAVATRKQLEAFVNYARENKAVIIYDAAYGGYISDPELPQTIYEIEGAKSCAVEINSFSKDTGFTGVRLGWSIVSQDLVVEGTEPGKVNTLWGRRQNTFFNGASNIVQLGALSVFTEEGEKECQEMIGYYMENARIIREGLESIGLTVYGGVHAPYLWLKTPGGMSSWDFFDKLLSETHVVGTPGSGFGPAGEGYFRLSSFGHREDIEKAVRSITGSLEI